MKKFFYTLMLPVVISGSSYAQSGNLPIREWSANTSTPFVLYISGDGGFNGFSTDLCKEINNDGYQVTAINAKSYFWDKKTPEQTTADISSYLLQIFNNRTNQQLVLIGYSFGADVMPFIVNKLPGFIKKKLLSVFLLAPSTSTDFEIHWSDIFGGHTKRSMDVVAEINKMNVPRAVILMGENEADDFPLKTIHIKNYTAEILPGSHHFGGDTDELVKRMMKYFR